MGNLKPTLSQVLITIGLLSTLIYGALIYLLLQRYDLNHLSLPELGIFLGGAAVPLGFLWLVLGFVQQGQALKRQGDVLKKLVKHQEQARQRTRGRSP